MREQMILELSNDYAYVLLTLLGVIGVMLYVYRGRKRERQKTGE